MEDMHERKAGLVRDLPEDTVMEENLVRMIIERYLAWVEAGRPTVR